MKLKSQIMLATLVSLFSVSLSFADSHLASLSDEKICDGQYNENDWESYVEEAHRRGLTFFCMNRKCLEKVVELREYLQWYEIELKENLDQLNMLSLSYNLDKKIGSRWPVDSFLKACEGSKVDGNY